MFIEGEIIILKTGGEFKVLAVSFKNMSVYAQSTNNKLGLNLSSFSWDEIRVNENREIAIKEYKRRRQIDDLLRTN